MTEDSQHYKDKKKFFNSFITIYGRKPVLEALQDDSLAIHKIHLADSNKPAAIIKDIVALCQQRNIEVSYHDKKSLSRISRNSKQDQGIAADIAPDHYQSVEEFLADKNTFS
jgi:23S rRNA (guanosine2251-2'-O)-methyltransferase